MPSRCDTVSASTLEIPRMSMRLPVSRLNNGKDHRVRAMGALVKCGGAHFATETAMNAKAQARNRMAKLQPEQVMVQE